MNSQPKPPKHLTREAKAQWQKFYESSDMDAQGLLLLNTLAEQFDLMRAAQNLIRTEGLIVVEKTAAGHEKKRPHPAVEVQSKAAAAMMRAWRLLGFDQLPPA
jgi:phage terminase small subunit